jgi:hypothetical protein
MTTLTLRCAAIALCLPATAGCVDRQDPAQPPAPTDSTDSHPTPPGATMSQSKMNVLAYRYHPVTQVLSIRYSGGIYRYAMVTQPVYDAWVSDGANEMATSKHLTDRYQAVYVQPGRSDPAIDP